ncbi:signal peptidase II [Brachybacterium alimentarium]|uniref:signal peptidase II n=1 Tax=Brachybacterium alimentarium TaxID=47845 RepID=UPI002163A6AD|nr:signal peptidase II [Brachybacterium alimentarium]
MSHADTTPTSAGPSGSGARRRLPRGGVLGGMLLVGGALAVADQLTKNWAEANLHELVPQPFLGEFLQLTLLYNSGAAWGMGSGITPVVTCLQVAIVIGVIVFAVRAVRSPWYTLALGLVLGGALGNIHDRLLRPPGPFHGEVVDFLELPHWPVFNVADMAVVGGALLIVLLGVIGHAADPAEVDAEAEAEAEARAQGESPTDSVASPDNPESPKGTR